MTAITTSTAPAPSYAFSPGIRIDGVHSILQVSGQGPIDPTNGLYQHPGDVTAQTLLTLANVQAVLQAGGATFADVIGVRVYLTDRAHFGEMNDAYAQFMQTALGEHPPPARTTVMVGLPHQDMLVEIDALAALTHPSPVDAS